ncbi:MAG: sporulation protein YqfD [Firmicutes bacterium]|nr:sporulation protein YqfD [Bacillota bacterium]
MPLMAMWFRFFGYVIIKIKGESPEAFLNAILSQGLHLWDVQRLRPDCLVARTSIKDFRRMRPSCRQAKIQVSILERRGLPFFLARLWRRPMLIGGGLAFLAVVCYLATFVWFIQVEGNQTLDAEDVLAILAEQGLRPGVPKKELEPKQLERALLLHLPRLAWAGVEIQGTLAKVVLVEKTFTDESQTGPGDIIAAKDGVVVNVIAFNGTPLVRQGDTVRRGQKLISGELGRWHRDYARLIARGQLPYLRASGIVEARVWYEEEVYVPLQQTVLRETGRCAVFRELHWKERVWAFGGLAPEFSYFKETREIRRLPGVARMLPLELHTVTHQEQTSIAKELSPEEAVGQGEGLARLALQARIPREAMILAEQLQITSKEPWGVWIRVVVETRENIREFRPVSQLEGKVAVTHNL